MCGIFAYFGHNQTHEIRFRHPCAICHRGPDSTNTQIGYVGSVDTMPYYLVFHRLAINGLDANGEQPMTLATDRHITLMCNGEIYNYRELIERYDLASEYISSSDCEVILHLYKRLGFAETIRQLRGDFAIVLVDRSTNRIYAGRDPHGVRALYYGWSPMDGLAFCSELKGLHGIFYRPGSYYTPVDQFPAGCYVDVDAETLISEYGTGTGEVLRFIPYYNFDHKLWLASEVPSEDVICQELRRLLTESVRRRLLCERTTSDGVPAIGAYLSGGFDSSVVAAIAQREYPGKLQTFSIGFENSPDLLAARKVAAMIESDHHEYVVTEEMALDMLPRVIQSVETMDITTIRASTFMLMLSYYIRDNSSIKVVFSGEGSDEMGSYAYFKNAPDEESFQKEACRLLQELPYYDAQRADRCSAAAGLELRVPFLDRELVEYYMRIPPNMRTQGGIEKYLLRQACSSRYGPALLPEEILWRPKEAMSNGVSLVDRDWSKIIQEYAIGQRYMGQGTGGFRSIGYEGAADPLMAEREMFRNVFLSYYPGCQHLLRHYWLPKWCGDIQDPSARLLRGRGLVPPTHEL